MRLQTLDLHEIIPPVQGVTVYLEYKFADDEFGEGLLFRAPDDPNHISISAPRGRVEVVLSSPQFLYWQEFDGSSALRFVITGFKLPP